jgi:hypothetical protein
MTGFMTATPNKPDSVIYHEIKNAVYSNINGFMVIIPKELHS